MKDKEKQFIERVECGVAYCEDTAVNEIKQDFKTQEEKHKQIEEMEYDISYVDNNGYYYDEDGYQQDAYANCHKIAEELIKKGWIKPNKDSIVLSREKYREFLEMKRDMINNTRYKRGSKETAEKILRKIKERVKTRYTLLGSHTCYGDIEFEIDNIADEIGVEIKE